MSDIIVPGTNSDGDKYLSDINNITCNESDLHDDNGLINLEIKGDEGKKIDNVDRNKGEKEKNKMTNLEKLLEKSLMKAYLYTSLPPFISQLTASLLLFVDGIVISSLLNNEGLSGLTYATSIQFILQGFAQIISTGSISILSTLIGSKESLEYRDLIPSIIFWLNIIFSMISYLILLFLKDFFILIGAENTVLNNSYDYGAMLIYTCPVFYFNWTFSMALLAEGLSRWNMLSNILSAALNAPFSYLLIKYANLGIKGAALGSTCSCFISGSLCISLFFTNKTVTKIRPLLVFKRFKESLKLTKRIILIGIGDGLSFVAMTITNSLFHYFFGRSFTPEEKVDGFASIGAFTRTYALFVSFFLGLGSLGYLPIAGYYIGQKNKDKLMKITNYAALSVSLSLIFISIICMSLYKYIGSLYSTNEVFLYYYKLCSIEVIPTLFINGVQYVYISFGQALGLNIRLAVASILCLVFYQPILLIIFYYTTHSTFYLLLSYPGNDILSIITLLLIFYKPLKKPDNYILNQVKSIQEKVKEKVNQNLNERVDDDEIELKSDDQIEIKKEFEPEIEQISPVEMDINTQTKKGDAIEIIISNVPQIEINHTNNVSVNETKSNVILQDNAHHKNVEFFSVVVTVPNSDISETKCKNQSDDFHQNKNDNKTSRYSNNHNHNKNYYYNRKSDNKIRNKISNKIHNQNNYHKDNYYTNNNYNKKKNNKKSNK